MRLVVLIGASLIGTAAIAGPYHYHDHFARDAIVGAAVVSTLEPPYVIAPVPFAALTPSGAGRSQAGPTPVADEIGKLAVLHDKGVLTDDEFKRQKSYLLGGR